MPLPWIHGVTQEERRKRGAESPLAASQLNRPRTLRSALSHVFFFLFFFSSPPFRWSELRHAERLSACTLAARLTAAKPLPGAFVQFRRMQCRKSLAEAGFHVGVRWPPEGHYLLAARDETGGGGGVVALGHAAFGNLTSRDGGGAQRKAVLIPRREGRPKGIIVCVIASASL